jgi:hypothetical protein
MMAGGMTCLEHLAIRASTVSSGSTGVKRKGERVIFVGVDWAEAHHDVAVKTSPERRPRDAG